MSAAEEVLRVLLEVEELRRAWEVLTPWQQREVERKVERVIVIHVDSHGRQREDW